MDKFELLALAKDFIVRRSECGYDVESKNSELVACVEGKTLTFYLTNCYNSGTDYREIEIDELMKLKAFCELLMEE